MNTDMSSNDKATDTTPPEQQELMRLIRDYLIPVAVGVAAALVLVGGYALYRSHRLGQAQKAAESLMQAASIEDVQQIARDYADTPTGPAALLRVAVSHYENGQYMMARSVYEQFIRDYPEHIMRSSAVLGQAYCLEAEGEFEQAITAYAAFASQHPGFYLVPAATFGQSRCYEQLGRFDEARAVLEDFIVQNPESRWVQNARTAVDYVNKAQRAHARGPVARPPRETPFQPAFPPSEATFGERAPVVLSEVIEVAPPEVLPEAETVVIEEQITEEPETTDATTADEPEAAE